MFPQSLRIRNQRGFYLIALLIVLAILGILYGKQLLGDKSGPGMITYIDRSKGAACSVNRSSLATNASMWGVSHAGEAITIEKLQQSNLSVPSCPEHGVYEIGPDGTIYCSKHFPRPIEVPAATPGAVGSQPPVVAPGPIRALVTPATTPNIPAE